MLKGVAAAFLGYGLLATADASIKALGRHLPVAEIALIIMVMHAMTLPWARQKGEQWRHVFHMNRPLLVVARSLCSVGAMLLTFYALTTVPLAEAYSLFFLMPAFATLFSIPLSGERVGWRRWTAILIGFVGVLIVVRPGFRDLHLGHLAAAAAAAFSGLGLALLRLIGPTEKRTSILATLYVAIISVSALLTLPVFTLPRAADLGIVALGGIAGGIAQIVMIYASSHAPPARVAPAQYSQIVWAVLFGAVFFAEFPDPWVFAGMVLVVGSGLFTFLREEQLKRARPDEPALSAAAGD
jgi:S-adenosylmethionine uptake transporter